MGAATLLCASGGAACAGYVVMRTQRSYRDWLELGPGGLPASWLGFVATSALRPLMRETTSTAVYASHPAPHRALRDTLVERAGARPRFARFPIPHRQLDQLAPAEIPPLLQALFDRAVAERAGVCYRPSWYERHSSAITLKNVEGAPGPLHFGRGEVAHIHPRDGSMHMLVSPPDAKAIIDSRWGERHPLAGVGGRFIPSNYLYVYPPRDERELSMVSLIVEAALSYALSGR